jgi:tetratricopeptide (TPR) repeat protein
MSDTPLKTDVVILESGSDDPSEWIRQGIQAAKAEEFERGLIYLAAAYRRLSQDREAKLPAAALSYYGLCLAKHKGRIKEAAEFCQLALEREFYNPEHYLNLGQVYVAGRSRRKAVDAIERGLAVDPNNVALQKLRLGLGVRRPPVIPFLHRDNPLNRSLGKVRQQVKGVPQTDPKMKKKR